jgi:hypothetical protein
MSTIGKKAHPKGVSNPLHETLQTVPGMPEKLKIYKITNSKFWWARVFVNGRYRIRSLKTESLRDARAEAKKFFVEVHMSDQLGITSPKNSIESDGFVNVGQRFVESLNMPGHQRRYLDDRQRFLKHLAPTFSSKTVGDITSADIGALQKKLVGAGKSAATVNHYTGVLRKILKYALDNRLISALPNFPKIPGRSVSTTRDYFPQEEYKDLVATIEKMAREGVKVRGVLVTLEFKYLVQFMVNSFIRPSDLRVLRHKHVVVQNNPDATRADEKQYLELRHPATKTTDREVITMPAAHGVYQSLLKLQKQRDYGLAEQYVFFPEYSNRNTMMTVAGRIFREVVNRSNIPKGSDKHTLYSLRHTSIMYRLLWGSVDTLVLAKNARTSQAMIDKFYASRLAPSQMVGAIHSQRKRQIKKVQQTP